MRDGNSRENGRSSWEGTGRPEGTMDKESGLDNVILAVVISLIVIISFLVLFLPEIMQPPPTVEPCIGGQFGGIWTSTTSARVTFAGICSGTSPEQLIIVLERGEVAGTYVFNNNLNGTVLTLISGISVGTITYLDYTRNGTVNPGDVLYITDLDPGTSYTVRLHWEDFATLDSCNFTTRFD